MNHTILVYYCIFKSKLVNHIFLYTSEVPFVLLGGSSKLRDENIPVTSYRGPAGEFEFRIKLSIELGDFPAESRLPGVIEAYLIIEYFLPEAGILIGLDFESDILLITNFDLVFKFKLRNILYIT